MIRTFQTDTGLRQQFELLVEPEVRKVLTLEQLFAVLRRTLRPDTLTQEDRDGVEEETQTVFQSGGGERFYRIRTGVFTRMGRTVRYYLDDDLVNNEDGTLTAALLWWETDSQDPEVGEWFAQLAREIEEAQENLLLFNRI